MDFLKAIQNVVSSAMNGLQGIGSSASMAMNSVLQFFKTMGRGGK